MNAQARLGWIRRYEQLGHAGVVCRRCGISRSTLRNRHAGGRVTF